ncbi:unnamed protein product [Closterium sp. Naga37s-1]|nr:unnamed protein product [Closterium sp. Naga37s-1]
MTVPGGVDTPTWKGSCRDENRARIAPLEVGSAGRRVGCVPRSRSRAPLAALSGALAPVPPLLPCLPCPCALPACLSCRSRACRQLPCLLPALFHPPSIHLPSSTSPFLSTFPVLLASHPLPLPGPTPLSPHSLPPHVTAAVRGGPSAPMGASRGGRERGWGSTLGQGVVGDNNRMMHILQDFHVRDVFREFNPDERQFTFYCGSVKVSSRIERVLVSQALLHLVARVAHRQIPKGITDHLSGVCVRLVWRGAHEPGPGVWRFPARLAKRPGVKAAVAEVVQRHEAEGGADFDKLSRRLGARLRKYDKEERGRVKRTRQTLERRRCWKGTGRGEGRRIGEEAASGECGAGGVRPTGVRRGEAEAGGELPAVGRRLLAAVVVGEGGEAGDGALGQAEGKGELGQAESKGGEGGSEVEGQSEAERAVGKEGGGLGDGHAGGSEGSDLEEEGGAEETEEGGGEEEEEEGEGIEGNEADGGLEEGESKAWPEGSTEGGGWRDARESVEVAAALGEAALPLPSLQVNSKPAHLWRVAVCLVGGARDFELTGPSIVQRLLLPLLPHRPVLFLHAPLDHASFKLWPLLWAARRGVAVGAVRVFPSTWVNESALPERVVEDPSSPHGTQCGVAVGAVRAFPSTWVNESALPPGLVEDPSSPHGTQGMLQYFCLVEGCIPLIHAYERRHAITFDWLLRTRVDTFWHRPLPPLAAFPPHAYTIPFGSDCFGLNDRFGLGTWHTALPALSRLSMLPAIAAGGAFRQFSMQGVGGLGQEASNSHAIPVEVPTGLNSEQAFKAQLALAGVAVARADLSFCVVSRRVYRHHSMPVLSLNTSTPLNGAKCRPCYPKIKGAEANLRIRQWYLEGSRFGPHRSPSFANRTDFALCDAAKPWPAPHVAAALFDAAAGPRLARERHSIMHVTLQGCARNFRKLRRHAEEWQAPAEAVLCFRSQLGELHLLGPPGHCFYTALHRVNRTRCTLLHAALMHSLYAAFTHSLSPRALLTVASADHSGLSLHRPAPAPLRLALTRACACSYPTLPASLVMTTTPRAAHAKGSWEWSMRRHAHGLQVTALSAGPTHASSIAHTLKVPTAAALLSMLFLAVP